MSISGMPPLDPTKYDIFYASILKSKPAEYDQRPMNKAVAASSPFFNELIIIENTFVRSQHGRLTIIAVLKPMNGSSGAHSGFNADGSTMDMPLRAASHLAAKACIVVKTGGSNAELEDFWCISLVISNLEEAVDNGQFLAIAQLVADACKNSDSIVASTIVGARRLVAEALRTIGNTINPTLLPSTFTSKYAIIPRLLSPEVVGAGTNASKSLSSVSMLFNSLVEPNYISIHDDGATLLQIDKNQREGKTVVLVTTKACWRDGRFEVNSHFILSNQVGIIVRSTDSTKIFTFKVKGPIYCHDDGNYDTRNVGSLLLRFDSFEVLEPEVDEDYVSTGDL